MTSSRMPNTAMAETSAAFQKNESFYLQHKSHHSSDLFFFFFGGPTGEPLSRNLNQSFVDFPGETPSQPGHRLFSGLCF